MNWPAYYRMGDTVTRIFLILTSESFIFNFTSIVINQKYYKTSISSYMVWKKNNWIWQYKIPQKYIN